MYELPWVEVCGGSRFGYLGRVRGFGYADESGVVVSEMAMSLEQLSAKLDRIEALLLERLAPAESARAPRTDGGYVRGVLQVLESPDPLRAIRERNAEIRGRKRR